MGIKAPGAANRIHLKMSRHRLDIFYTQFHAKKDAACGLRPSILCSFLLALDAACGKTGGEVFLNGHEEDDNGDNGNDGGGKEILPLDDIIAVEDVDTDSEGLDGVGGDKAESHGELVPCVDENEDQGGDNAGGRHRQQNSQHGLNTVAAVNGGSLLHLGRDAHKCAAQKPHGKGLVESSVYEDKTQQGIGHAEELDDLVDTDEQHNGGKHLGHDDEAEKHGLTLELHTGEGICCGNAAEHCNNSGAASHDNGVEQVLAHGSQSPDINKV